jgi:cell division protein FtsB
MDFANDHLLSVFASHIHTNKSNCELQKLHTESATMRLITTPKPPRSTVDSRLDKKMTVICKNPSPKNVVDVLPSSPIYTDIEGVLSDYSDEEARSMLSTMVLSLLNESDALRKRNVEYEGEIHSLKQQINTCYAEDRKSWSSILAALTLKTGEPVCSSTEGPVSSNQAATFVVQSLVSKVETLSTENGHLKSRNNHLEHKLEELASENDAYVQKIAALEDQFTKINKTRQKVVSRIVNRSEYDVKLKKSSFLAEV